MALFEVLVLDGLTLTGDPTGTLVLESLDAPPPKARLEWISTADSEGAALLRDPEHENREIAVRLRVAAQASMNLALDQVGNVVDKLRRAALTPDGVAMTWTPANSTRTVTFDVLAGEIDNLPITWNGDDHGWFANRPVLSMKLTCKPYWRSSTETLSSTATTSTPITTIEVASVPGDIPALGRLIVTDNATQNRRHVEWGIENLYYDNTTSLIVDSDSLVTSGFAGAQTTLTGSYDPNASGNNVISVSTAAQTIAMCGTGNLTHKGVFRVKARVQVLVTPVRYRLAWKVGDGPLQVNAWAEPPIPGRFAELDLGTINATTVTSGTQRWTGQIEVLAPTGVITTAYVDYLLLIPATEGYGVSASNVTYGASVAIVGRDEFTSTTAGNALSARTAPAGGTWATSGDATDFTFSDYYGEENVQRATASSTSGRYAILGSTNYTDTQTQVDVNMGAGGAVQSGNVMNMGAIARWTDASNHVRFYVDVMTGRIVLSYLVAGVSTDLGVWPGGLSSNVTYTLRLTVYATGRAVGLLLGGKPNYTAMVILDGLSTVLATGGTLATGKPGFWDYNTTTTTPQRFYDGFAVMTPQSESVALYSTRSMQVRWDDTIRQDSTGTYSGRPPSYRGTRFLVPPGTSRVAVKANRQHVGIGQEATPVTDSTTIQVGYTPRGLVVPR